MKADSSWENAPCLTAACVFIIIPDKWIITWGLQMRQAQKSNKLWNLTDQGRNSTYWQKVLRQEISLNDRFIDKQKFILTHADQETNFSWIERHTSLECTFKHARNAGFSNFCNNTPRQGKPESQCLNNLEELHVRYIVLNLRSFTYTWTWHISSSITGMNQINTL